MRAMRVDQPAAIATKPLHQVGIPLPEPQGRQIRIRVETCGVCLTDLHVVEGDLPFLGPVVPGHQVVGVVEAAGAAANRFHLGDCVGAAWLHATCGSCRFCNEGRENLCREARFTGYHGNGGFAETMLAEENFVYAIPPTLDAVKTAPLLCAGIIGYRALLLSGALQGGRLGLYGFGASAHIAIQIARHVGCEIYVFSRSAEHRALAQSLGAVWTGRAEEAPPHRLDAAILFAPSGRLVPEALRVLERGGKLALAGIHMSPVPELDYRAHLYDERCIQSVANNTREDGEALLRLAVEIPIHTHTQKFSLADANEALLQLNAGRINGAAVLRLKE